ncbi:hypothetical protein ACFOY8_12290 [Thalassospira xianhensis]|uniref:methyltransferase n=1 Tax=Thalassospira xianhensis TaxID=478503 RepID=UPI000DEE0123|nr:methyltransferase [Thalassospira xianhensis]
MAKLTKQQAKLHAQACEILQQDVLSLPEREFVLEHWREDANHVNSPAGAFMTPFELANSFAYACSMDEPGRYIDLCAGIGALSFHLHQYTLRNSGETEYVCVEINPDYAEVGRKILPEATWIVADVFDIPNMDLGRFDVAIGNPPFGRINRNGKSGPNYNGPQFEYHVIDIASQIADDGYFIIPQESAPFRFSGRQSFKEETTPKHDKFLSETGFQMSCVSIDTSFARNMWRGTSPAVEIVAIKFPEPRLTHEPVPAMVM